MKLLALGQNAGQWNAADRPFWKDYQSGAESWLFCPGVEGDYCNVKLATPELIANYDIVMGNPGNLEESNIIPDLLALQKFARKWITMFDDVPPVTEEVKALLDGSDLVNVLNSRVLEFFRSITKTRCEVLGMPYPTLNLKRTGKDIFIASRLYHGGANIDALVAQPLAEEFGVKVRGIYLGDPIPNYFPACDTLEYLTLLAEHAYIFIDLDFRYTWARDVLDCSALSIPCIVTESTTHSELFPLTTVKDRYDFNNVRALVRQLYSSPAFYSYAAKAQTKPLDHEAMIQKLLSLL